MKEAGAQALEGRLKGPATRGVGVPVVVGIVDEGSGVRQIPGEEDTVGVKAAVSRGGEGDEEVAKVAKVAGVAGDLGASTLGKAQGAVGAPKGGRLALANEGVGDGDVADEGGVGGGRKGPADVANLVATCLSRLSGAGQLGGLISGADVGVIRDLAPHSQDISVCPAPGTMGVHSTALHMMSPSVVETGTTAALSNGHEVGADRGRKAYRGTCPDLPLGARKGAKGAGVELAQPGEGGVGEGARGAGKEG